MKISREPFGLTKDGIEVERFTFAEPGRIETSISNYGGLILTLKTPDRQGRMGDVVLGHDDFTGYLEHHRYIAGIIGRCANRITGGVFELDGTQHQLPLTHDGFHLHGGFTGFNSRVWLPEIKEAPEGPRLELRYLSPAGEEGYPGNLSARVDYTVSTADASLRIDYYAQTDAPTIVNMTNHAYFNLTADPDADCLNHIVTINARYYLPGNSLLIPTGELAPVEGTPFDFRQPHPIGLRIGDPHEQLQLAGGYDHNYCLNNNGLPKKAAEVHDPESGRRMKVLATQPGMQFYTANFLAPDATGKKGVPFQKHGGFCFETQGYPDAPNHINFPSIILRPREQYHQTTIFRFSAED